MEPERMSDTAARAVIAECMKDLRFRPAAVDDDEHVNVRIKLNLLSVDSTVEGTTRNALAVRRAMETLNALACCRGFRVEENAAFWRRVMGEQEDEEDIRTNIRVLAADIFSRYHVDVRIEYPVEMVAWAIATCFTQDPTSEAMRVRSEIHGRLARFLPREPPMLDIQMEADGREPITRILFEVDQIWKRTATPNVHERIGITIRTGADGETLLKIRECVLLACVELRELKAWTRNEPASVARELSTLMRELVRVDTVRKMSWSFSRCDETCLGAIFSAIPSMSSLDAFKVACSDLGRIPTYPLTGRGEESYVLWATYALLARSLVQRPASAGLQILEGTSDLCERVLRSSSALLEVAMPGRFDDVVSLPHSASATLRSRAIVQTIGAQTPPFVALHDRQVNVIALTGSRAIIVWPGVGLVWTESSNLFDWRTRTPAAWTQRAIVRDLTCLSRDLAAIASFLELVGAGLQSLHVELIDPHNEHSVERIVRACPRLKKLHVSMLLATDRLNKAYETGLCHVSTLTIGYFMNGLRLTAFLQALADQRSPMARQIKRLAIVEHFLMPDDVPILAAILRSHRRIEYVRLCARIPEEVAGQFGEEPVRQTKRSKRAAYTFLLAARRHRVLRALPLPCAQIIAAFAGTPMLRRVAWEPWES